MSERVALFLWTLLGAVSFALVGLLFGALAGWLSWRRGNASGTLWSRRLGENLRLLLRNQPSPSQQAALIGALDGALFLGAIGLSLGFIAGWRGDLPSTWVLGGLSMLVPLVVGAVIFGLLALGLVSRAGEGLFALFLGGMSGALLSAYFWGHAHIVPGAILGLFLGFLASLLGARRQ